MTLILTGTQAPWIVPALAVLGAAVAFGAYRGLGLRRPWSLLLPLARAAAFALAAATLLQPVLARFRTERVRGRIPVVIDNSGSMSVADRYPAADAVAIASDLGWIAPGKRSAAFTAAGAEIGALRESMDAILRNTEEVGRRLRANRPWGWEIQRLIADTQQRIHAALREAARQRGALSAAARGTACLKAEIERDAAATNHPSAFAAGWREADAAFAGFDAGLSRATELLESIGQDTEAGEAISRTLDAATSVRNCESAREDLRGRLARLQDAADAALAAGGDAEVSLALRRLAGMRRGALVQMLLDGEPFRLASRLDRLGRVELLTLDEGGAPLPRGALTNLQYGLPSTRLGSAVADALSAGERRPVSAVLVLSDGNLNAGKPAAEAAAAAREVGIPVLCVGIGSTNPPADVAIAGVTAPDMAFRRDTLRVGLALKRDGFTDRPIAVRVTSEGREVQRLRVEPGPQSRVALETSFQENRGGMQRFTVEAERFAGEALEQNNRQSFSVHILEDRIRVLLVDEFPRRESRAIHMMLSRDARVDLTTVFAGAAQDGRAKLGRMGYPESRDALCGYHLVVLGDVNPRHFSNAQFDDIKAFVLARGGTLICIAGENYMPAHYQETPLKTILPVRITGRRPEAGRAAVRRVDGVPAWRLALTPRGAEDDLSRLADTTDGTRDAWRNVPALDWVRQGVLTSGAGECLVEAMPLRLPVLVKAYAGLGKVLYLGTDSLWRWRGAADGAAYGRLWGQFLLWATMGRTTGTDRHVKLTAERVEYAPGETVVLKARILGDGETPLETAKASAWVYDGEGALVKSVPFFALPNSGGEYRAQIRDLPRGKYRAVPDVVELHDRDIHAEAGFEVRDLPTGEYVDLSLNADQLAAMGTDYRPLNRAAELLDKVPVVERSEEYREDYELWDSLPVLAIIAGLLGFEWLGRKRNRLA